MCESIADASSVSAAALYMGNQAILSDCGEAEPAIRLCLPMACRTNYLRPSDTCAGIGVALGLDFDSVQNYNSWLEALCTNLHTAADFYGMIICVSPQDGTSSGTVPTPTPTAIPGTNDGYTHAAVAAPEGLPMAEGTALNCGCLFHAVNSSLQPNTFCTLPLNPGTALYTGPPYKWNITVPVTSTIWGPDIMSSTTVADNV
ncbi:hypothetical protein DL768_009914 [Monosporascus sp. mg162]|nr:hypothetical protein DL768_009914 [Monosporascus sp. mg162]